MDGMDGVEDSSQSQEAKAKAICWCSRMDLMVVTSDCTAIHVPPTPYRSP